MNLVCRDHTALAQGVRKLRAADNTRVGVGDIKKGGLRNESWGQGEGQERHSDNGRAGEEEAQAEFSSCGFALAP